MSVSTTSFSADPMALLAADRERAAAQRDPMADRCVLATVDEGGAPALRTLVLRGVDARAIQVFVNRHSPKWTELHASGRFELLCWYPSLGLQYRLRGGVEAHDPDAVRRSWMRKPYRTRLLDWYYEHEREQSAPLRCREDLIAGHRRMRARYPDPEEMPVPDGVRGLDLVVERAERLDLNAAPVQERRAFTRRDGTWREMHLVP